MIALRSSDELFAIAARGELAADGYRFAVANEIERTVLTYAQFGRGFVRVSSGRDDPAIAAGRVLALTGGAVAIRAHVEELFEVALFAISPRGGHAAFTFRHGASGLVLQGGPAHAGAALGQAWATALATVEPVAFSIRAASDFGRVTIGAKGAPPHRPPFDPTAFERAEAAARGAGTDEDAARALRELYVAYLAEARFGPDAIPEKRYRRAADPLEPRSIAWLEAAVAALSAGEHAIPALIEHVGAIVDARTWFARMTALAARRALAHPWEDA